MKLFAAVFLGVLAVAFGRTAYKLGDRIVGGKETDITLYPYQVSLQYKGYHYCGGSILNENTILTATHCLEGFDLEDLSVKAGVTEFLEDVEAFKIAEVIKHDGYEEDIPNNNDIAIIKLASKLTYSDKIKPIEITTEAVPDGTKAFVTGWGAMYDGDDEPSLVLRVVDVNTVNHDECVSKYGPDRISDNMLCAAAPYKDSCEGDSGGPLAADGKLIGVVSFGQGCASPTFPGVYADVAYFNDFITSNM